MIHYGMTKTAQLAISRGLAGLTKGTKVTVNSVLPGPTRSEGIIDFLKSLASDPAAPPEQIEAEFFAKGRPSSLLQRMIEPDEIANLVAYWQARCLQPLMVLRFASTAASRQRSLRAERPLRAVRLARTTITNRQYPTERINAMSFVNVKLADDVFIWLGRATLVVAIITAGRGTSVLLDKPVTAWFAASATMGIVLLFHLRGLAAARLLHGHCGAGAGHRCDFRACSAFCV